MLDQRTLDRIAAGFMFFRYQPFNGRTGLVIRFWYRSR